MFNVIIAGVGGQGSLLASHILGRVLLNHYPDVKVSEVHGMSQRGGSVVTYVRAGERVASPIVPVGECDLLIALEGLEVLRWRHFVHDRGFIAASSQRINPMPVITGAAQYPSDTDERLSRGQADYLMVPADRLAAEAGSVKASNVVLIGAASVSGDFTEGEWVEALTACVPPKFLDMNLKAFALGREFALNNKVAK